MDFNIKIELWLEKQHHPIKSIYLSKERTWYNGTQHTK